MLVSLKSSLNFAIILVHRILDIVAILRKRHITVIHRINCVVGQGLLEFLLNPHSVGHVTHVKFSEEGFNLVRHLSHPIVSKMTPVNRAKRVSAINLRVPLFQRESGRRHCLDHLHVVSEHFSVALVANHLKRHVLKVSKSNYLTFWLSLKNSAMWSFSSWNSWQSLELYTSRVVAVLIPSAFIFCIMSIGP